MNFQLENSSATKPRLTERELEVLKLLCEGLTPCEIAKVIHTSKRTVDTHKTNIMAKFNVTTATKLIIVALKSGFVD